MEDPSSQTGTFKSSRQKFTPEEDEKLRELVKIHGDHAWKVISREIKTRSTRQCRERYRNYLSPEIRNGPWAAEEDKLLEEKYKQYGPKWSQIALFFDSRSDVNVKNRHALLLSKGLAFCPMPMKIEKPSSQEKKDPISVIFDDSKLLPAEDFWSEDSEWESSASIDENQSTDSFSLGTFNW